MKRTLIISLSFFLFFNCLPCKAQITNEQKKVIVEESLNWLGRTIDKGVINKNTKKSKEQIAQWEKEGNWCAIRCHRLNEETGNIDYDFECEVRCNQKQREEESRMRRKNAEEIQRQTQPQSLQVANNGTGLYAHVDIQEIFQLMPETAEMQLKLKQSQEQMIAELSAMENRYKTLLSEYQNNHENWSEAVLSTKQKELQSTSESYEQYRQNSQENIQTMQANLVKPIEEKNKKCNTNDRRRE